MSNKQVKRLCKYFRKVIENGLKYVSIVEMEKLIGDDNEFMKLAFKQVKLKYFYTTECY